MAVAKYSQVKRLLVEYVPCPPEIHEVIVDMMKSMQKQYKSSDLLRVRDGTRSFMLHMRIDIFYDFERVKYFIYKGEVDVSRKERSNFTSRERLFKFKFMVAGMPFELHRGWHAGGTAILFSVKGEPHYVSANVNIC